MGNEYEARLFHKEHLRVPTAAERDRRMSLYTEAFGFTLRAPAIFFFESVFLFTHTCVNT